MRRLLRDLVDAVLVLVIAGNALGLWLRHLIRRINPDSSFYWLPEDHG